MQERANYWPASKAEIAEVAEATTIGLSILQSIIKSWKDVNEPASSRKMCGRKAILNNLDRRSLKRLVKSNLQKSILELTKSFNNGSKTISIPKMK
ncbi:hypothetical protein AVEN_226872-1 [Araneus ventricosus]|uniref:Uncharacterized protein n=1 Tax=Araneus ventricosus TaxID=182803 RepID=A0A4Y2H8T0_ARAVE|nr:hypothetical protein AVEN_226872-1 [Araneus ventricosus]